MLTQQPFKAKRIERRLAMGWTLVGLVTYFYKNTGRPYSPKYFIVYSITSCSILLNDTRKRVSSSTKMLSNLSYKSLSSPALSWPPSNLSSI